MATSNISVNNAYQLSCSPTFTTGSYTTYYIKPANPITSSTSYRWGIITGDGNGLPVFTVFSFHNGHISYMNLSSELRQLTLSWDLSTNILTIQGSNWSSYSVLSNYGPWIQYTGNN